MKVLRRLAVALAAAAAIVTLSAQPAAAKLPYFTVELQPGVPVPGAAATVVVRTFADAHHTAASEISGFTTLPRLFCAFPPGSNPVRPGTCAGGVWVDVARTAPNTYTGSVVFPSAGTWTLVSFPEAVGPIGYGYPDRTFVRVGGPAVGGVRTLPGARPRDDLTLFWLGVALFAVLVVAGVVTERRRRAGRARL